MPGWLKLARNIAGGVLLLILLLLTGLWFWSYPPQPEKFFRAEAAPGTQPGRIIAEQAYRRGLPEGAQAVRILYTTTLNGGTPARATALVIWQPLAEDAPDPEAARRVLAWAHGTAGAVPGCGASLHRQPLRNVPVAAELLAEGWVLVASDYAGLTTAGPHPYLIGEGEARSVLDAVRAAHDIRELTLSLDTVIWGHSQGGHAALWSGILARSYAPELSIRGIAAIAPATDLPALLTEIEATPAGRLFSAYIARAYTGIYPDLYFDGVVRPETRWQAREIARRCLDGPRAVVPALIAAEFTEGSIFSSADTGTAFRRRLADNVPDRAIGYPLLFLQGGRDEVVPQAVQAGYVAARCRRGETVDYHTMRRADHMSILDPETGSGDILLRWTRARFEGRNAPSSCPP